MPLVRRQGARRPNRVVRQSRDLRLPSLGRAARRGRPHARARHVGRARRGTAARLPRRDVRRSRLLPARVALHRPRLLSDLPRLLGGRSRRSDARLAALAAAMSAFAGHGASVDSARGISIQTIHVLAAGTWFGGLPILLARIWHASRDGRESSNTVVAFYIDNATNTLPSQGARGGISPAIQFGNFEHTAT